MNCERDARFWKLDAEMEERWSSFERGIIDNPNIVFHCAIQNATPAFTKWLLELLRILVDSRENAGNVSLGTQSALTCLMSPTSTMCLLYLLSGVAGVTDEG